MQICKCKFETNSLFNFVTFKSPDEVKFESQDLSKISFSNTDITRIVFGDDTYFGKETKKEEERFKIFDEKRFEKYFEKNDNHKNDKKDDNESLDSPPLGSILASYRNLRENYEYRLRYDEAGKFFIREMELKRHYRNQFSKKENKFIPRKNRWFRRNFSFTGIYYRICKYGEVQLIR
jgi:hypothetical protein